MSLKFANPSSPVPFSPEYSGEGEPQSHANARISERADDVICELGDARVCSVSLRERQYRHRSEMMRIVALLLSVCLLLPMASAYPQTSQSDSDSLLNLLVKYNTQVLALGREHPEAMALRADIDARIKAGERCDVEKVTALLATLKKQYRGVRKNAGESHPLAVNAISNIAMLTELAAHEAEYLAEHVEAILKVKDNWISGVLYVPGGRQTGYVHRFEPEAKEITIPRGSEDGMKVGMDFHVYVRYIVPFERWLPDGKSYIPGQVISVGPHETQIQLSSSIPKSIMPSSIYFTQPSFVAGDLILAIKFDEEAWKNRPLMNAFLGDLLYSCSGKDLAKLKILVPDTPRSSCQIDVLPIGPKGHTEEQLRTLKALDGYVKEQSYFTNVKLNSVSSFEKNPLPAEKAASPNPGDTSSAPRNFSALTLGLKNWQDQELQGVKQEQLPDWISRLRDTANEAEKASIDKANEIRDALAAKPPQSSEEIEKLKVELRKSVEESFDARDRLQWKEFTALTIQVQNMLASLKERSTGRNEIVDRRVDDLLNPNYRWDSSSKTTDAGNRDVGWQETANKPLPGSSSDAAKTLGSVTGQVTGQVTFRGMPITGKIKFNATGGIPELPAGANIDHSGKFQMNGLPPGKYKVSIQADLNNFTKQIPAKFNSLTETPLEVEVVPGKNELQFALGK